MPQYSSDDRANAERLFKAREQQKADAPKATADYYAAQQRLRDRTQELRQLRLARDDKKKRSLARKPSSAPNLHGPTFRGVRGTASAR